MIASIPSVNVGDSPSEYAVEAMMTASTPRPATRGTAKNPIAARTRPPAITNAGCTRRASAGDRNDPIAQLADHGRIQSPALRGDKPAPSCRY